MMRLLYIGSKALEIKCNFLVIALFFRTKFGSFGVYEIRFRMGLKISTHLKFILFVFSLFVMQIGVAQLCTIVKFNAFPDSLNQRKKDTVICGGACLDLFANVPVLKGTTSYTVATIPFIDSLPCEGVGNIPNNFTQPNNVHSEKVSLGFDFCFFGNTYSKCMISDNGYISFDTTRATSASNYSLSTYPPIPNSNYVDYFNAIMGCCMDVFVPLNGSITTQTIGTAPFRVFIVKYIHCAYDGGACAFPANELDMKIVLYETTNIIDVYIKKKTICGGWNGGLAIQGLQDANGIVGFSTPGRNNTQWSANNDAKRFTPDGGKVNHLVKWYKGSNYLGTGLQQLVCPTGASWYRAELMVDSSCGIPQGGIKFSDSVFVNIKSTQSSTINYNTYNDTVRCNMPYITLDAGTAKSYRWNNGNRTRFLKVARTGTYTCQKMTDTTNCYFDTIIYNVYSEKVFLDSIQTSACFTQGLGKITIFGSGGSGSLQFQINNGNYRSSNSFDSLSYGYYHLKIKDGVGCELDSIININRPTINIIKRNTCGVDSIGTIVMDVKNFSGPYLYKLDTGSYKTDTFFVNVKGGTHTVSIKNALGCVYDSTFNAPFTSLKLNATYTIVKASGCTGGTPDGSITVNATGGNPPYRYSKNNASYKSSGYFGGLNEGGYLISVVDTFGCTIDSVVQVGALAHLYVNAYVINASCFNTNTASIVVNGFGGVQPYTFSFGGSLFSSVNTRTGLGAGTMTVAIKDGRGCIVDSVLPIGQPQPIQFAPTLTHLTCNGAANGQIKINTTGGIAPYLYAINGGTLTTNNIFSSLSAGVYSLRIKDFNNCIKDTTVTITQPFPVNFTINKTNTSCYNTSDGKFILTGYGGTSPYEYSFNGGAFSTRFTYDTLAKGNYTIRIKDAKGCTRDTIISILSPAKIQPTFVLKTVSCFGNINGTIKVIPSGGTPPCTYAINSSGFSPVDSFINVAAGTHNISIRDSRGCQFDTFTVISQPPNLFFNVTLKNLKCYNDSSGEITIAGNGGTLPYKYAIDADTFITNNVFKKKTAGNFVLHIKDANGCIYDTIVTLTQPTPLKMNVSVLQNVSCYNASTGELQTNGIGGTPPYLYRLNGGVYTDSVLHLNLKAGVYNVSVKDSNNCTFDTLVTITQPIKVTSQFFITNNTCFAGSDGVFKIRSSGGTPPYRFSIDSINFTFDSVFTNLPAGKHKVFIKDAIDCISDTLVDIQQPPKIITNSTVKNITCYNGNDGKITIVAGGGTPPYQCSIDDIVYNNVFTFSNLVAGKYKYYIKDSRNCRYDTTITVFQSTLMTNAFIVKSVSCFGSNDGAIRVITTGGSKPYKYSFNGGVFDTISIFSGLPIGTYNLQTKDTFNCIKDTTFTITQPPQIFAKAISTNVLCYNARNGTIDISATGGVPPFTYSLDNNGFSGNSKYYNLAPNTYKVSVRDALGCTRDTTLTITQPDSFTFNYKVKDATCYNGDDGAIEIHVGGATPPYVYAIGNAAFGGDTVFNNLRSGEHTIKIKDNNNCTVLRKVIVNQPPKPTLLPAEIIRVTWFNDSTVLLQWKKYPNALRYIVESKYQNSEIITDTFYYQKQSQSEIHQYRISVIDSCGFYNQKSLIHNTLKLEGYIEKSKTIKLSWNSYKSWQNGIQNYTIYKHNALLNTYEVAGATIDTFIDIPVLPEDTLTEYIFYVEATELSGNNAVSESNKLLLYVDPVVWIPNAFSPNKDGVNDILIPKGVGIKSYTLIIYDRWGGLLFKSDENTKYWDGKSDGTEVPVGTYIYELHAICDIKNKTLEEFFYKGTVQVVR